MLSLPHLPPPVMFDGSHNSFPVVSIRVRMFSVSAPHLGGPETKQQIHEKDEASFTCKIHLLRACHFVPARVPAIVSTQVLSMIS